PIDDTITVLEDGTATATAATGLLANDLETRNGSITAASYDSDNDGVADTAITIGTATAIKRNGVTVATVTINADGSYTIAPALNVDIALPLISYTLTTPLGSSTAKVNIGVTPVNDAPLLADTSLDMYATLGATVPTGAVGTRVVDLVGGVSDVDTGAVKGIAITASSALGTLYYSTDGGVTWTAIPVGSPISETSALLLAADANTRIYFKPTTVGADITNALTIRAWDRTSGTAGSRGDASAHGGSTAYSDATDTIAVHGNNAPVVNNAATTTYAADRTEDDPVPMGAVGSLISSYTGSISDADAGAKKGIAVTATAGDPASGTWWYTTDGGVSWTAIGTVSDASALLLADNANTRIYFQPKADFNGLVSASALTFKAWDQTSGTAGQRANASSGSAFSTATDTISVTVAAVNDAPVLVDMDRTLGTVAEDAAAPVGAVGYALTTAASGLFIDTTGITDVDGGSVRGFAITGADSANGTWYYSTNGGTNWIALGSVSDANALLLSNAGTNRLYFKPNADFNGTATLTIRAWDQSNVATQANGSRANVSVNGGTTAYSSATDTAAITVTPVADIVTDTLTTAEDTPITFDPLANDSFTAADRIITSVDGVAITAGGPAVAVTHGTLSLAADGRTLTFTPAADFNGAQFSWAYTVKSGGVTESSTATNLIKMTVTAVPDAPRIDLDTGTAGSDSMVAYDQISVALGPAISVSDPDGDNIASMTVTLAGATAADSLALAYSVTGVSGSYNAATGVLTLSTTNGVSGSTPAQFQTALQAVRYTSTSASAAARSITVSATSVTTPTASNLATATITPLDSDADGVINRIDIDDDNDGILDVVESPYSTDASIVYPVYTSYPKSDFLGTSKVITGTLGSVDFTVTSTQPMATTGAIFGNNVFPDEFDVPATGTAIANDNAATLTITFSQPVTNPVIILASIGQSGTSVPVEFSDPITLLFSQGITVNSATRITGQEGYAVVQLTGTFTTFSLQYLASEHWVNFAFAAQAAPMVNPDRDADGVADRLDLDSDNDGISDNVEAQSSTSFKPASGKGAAMIDADHDGLDDRYDANTADMTAAASQGLTPVNTYGGSQADYLDVDTDGDGTLDIAERGDGQPTSITLMADTDRDGLLDIFEHGSVNDGYNVDDGVFSTSGSGLTKTVTTVNLADSDNDTADNGSDAQPPGMDFDWRDNFAGVAPPQALDDTVTVTEDTTLAAGAASGLLANDLQARGATITAASYDSNGDGTPDTAIAIGVTTTMLRNGVAVGTIRINADGSYTIVPAANLDTALPVVAYTMSAPGGSSSARMNIAVTPVNDAPVLADTSLDLYATMPSNGAPSGAVGNLVSDLAGGISDVDTGAVKGLAITGFDASQGKLWYSTNNGATWIALTSASDAAALLLAADGNTRVYYQPNAGIIGDIANAVTVRAWDRSSGTAGGTANAGVNGGSTAFSTATDTIAVHGSNTAPLLSSTPVLTADRLEDDPAPAGAVGSLISDFTVGITDNDAGAKKGIAVTALDQSHGIWWYTTDGGTTWTQVGTVSSTSALLLADNGSTRLYFQPVADFNGNASSTALTFKAWDQTSGGNGQKGDTSISSAFSTGSDTVSVNVTPVNDAPVLVDVNRTIISVSEDSAAPAGSGFGTALTTIASLHLTDTGITDVDSGSLRGIAITAADSTNGTWWYTLDGGTTWQQVGTVSDTNALLLTCASSTKLYFQPKPDYNGTATLTIRAWDQTSGSSGGRGNASVNGGTTAFSTATDVVTATVTSVTDIANDTVTTPEDTVKVFSPITGSGESAGADSFSNPNKLITSIDGKAITAGGPAVAVNHGTMSLAADGITLSFTPDANYNSTTAISWAYTVLSGGVTEFGTINMTVTSVPDAPAIDLDTGSAGTGYASSYDQGAVAIGGAISVSDADGDNIASMTITLTNATAADLLSLSQTVNGITASYDVNSGVLTLTGSATTAVYQSALQLVRFSTTSGSSAARTITVAATSTAAPTASNVATAVLTPIDTDGDGVANAADIDDDNDGIIDDLDGVSPSLVGNYIGPTYWDVSSATVTNGTVTSGYSAIGAAFDGNTTSFTVYDPLGYDAAGKVLTQPMIIGVNALNPLTVDSLYLAPDTGAQGDGPYDVVLKLYDAQGKLLGTESFSGLDTTPTGYTTYALSKTYAGVARMELWVTSMWPGGGANTVQIREIGLALSAAGAARLDTDGDGIVDRLDLDSDNDGIPDNVEAQTTAGYKPPSGQGVAMIDVDHDGLDDRYDANTSSKAPGASQGLTPVDTDGDSKPDFQDTDSDGDGKLDITERGDGQPTSVTSTTDTDQDGLLDIFEHGTPNDGFNVNDGSVTSSGSGLTASVVKFNLADTDDDIADDGRDASPPTRDLDYRDNVITILAPVAADDTLATSEDTTLSANAAAGLLANDTLRSGATIVAIKIDTNNDGTPDTAITIGAATTVRDAAGRTAGALTINADGSYSFVPAADWYGSLPAISYTISNAGGSSTAKLTISLSAVADIVADTVSATEDTPVSFNPITGVGETAGADNFEDSGRKITQVDGQAITAGGAAITLASGAGTVSLAADGSTLTYTPAANLNGTVSFGYTVTAGGLTESSTITINVAAVDDAPVNTLPAAYAVSEDGTVPLIGLSVADVDAGSSTMTVTLTVASGTLAATSAAGVTVSGSGTGTLTLSGTLASINAFLLATAPVFKPVADFNGTVALSMVSSDGTLTDTDGSTITVAPVADIVADQVLTNEDTAVTFNPISGSGEVSGADGFSNPGRAITAIDGQAIAAGGTVAVAHGSVTLNADGTLTFTPAANYNGSASFGYTVTSSGVSESSTITVTIAAVNDAPVNTLPASFSVLEDRTLVLSGLAVTDVDSGTLTVTLTVSSGTLSATAGGGVTVSGSGTAALVLTGTVTDLNAFLAGLSSAPVFTPRPDFNGMVTLQMLSSDGQATDTDTGSIAVFAVADIVDDQVSTSEDTPVTFDPITGAGETSGADNFEDTGRKISAINGQAVVAGSTVTVSKGTVTLNADGTLTFTPTANANGSSTFSYTVSAGGVTETASITVTIAAVDDPFVNVLPASYAATEDVPLALTGLSVTDADGDNPVITVTLAVSSGTLSATGLAGVTVQNSGTASLTLTGTRSAINTFLGATPPLFTPAADANGAVTLTMSSSDGTAATADTDQRTITIAPVADIVADQVSTDEDTSVVFNPITGSGEIAGADNFEDGTAHITAIAGQAVTPGSSVAVANGTVTLNLDGTLSFVPTADANGSSVFSYTVTAGGVTETANITVTIKAVNDVPVNTLPASYTVAEDVPLALAGLSVADPDAGPMTLSLALTSGTLSATSGGGVVVAGSGTAALTLTGTRADIDAFLAATAPVFTPVADYNGDVTLQMISDDGTAQDSDSIAIHITPVADIVADQVATNEDTTLTFDALANDSFENPARKISAIDGQTITAGGPAVAVAGGAVKLNTDGTLSFSPTPDSSGTSSFSYTVSSGGVTETATVTVTVNAVNDAPVLADTALALGTIAEDSGIPTGAMGTAVSALTGGITDVDGSGLGIAIVGADTTHGTLYYSTDDGATWTALPAVSNGSALLLSAAGGRIAFVPTTDYNGSLASALTIRAWDGSSGTSGGTADTGSGGGSSAFSSTTDTVALTVTPVVDIVDDTVTTAEDTPVSFNVLANDTFENSGAYVSAVTQPAAAGTVSFLPDGTVTFTPAANFNGDASFSYTVTSGGVTESATVTIHVTPVADPVEVSGLGDGPDGTTDAAVYESALAGGTDAGSGKDVADGSFDVGPAANLASLTIGNSPALTPALLAAASEATPITIAGAHGTLEIIGYDARTGVLSYRYTLTGAVDHSGGIVNDSFLISTTDADGTVTANAGTLALRIVDDTPQAQADRDDMINIPLQPSSTASGNVLTGSGGTDPNSSDGTADIAGADGDLKVAGVVAGDTGAPSSGGVGSAIAGQYGDLVLQADGSYTYSPHFLDPLVQNITPGGHLTDVFTYTATDHDGSTSTTTISFQIVAIPAVVGTTGTVIDEADLPGGTQSDGGPALVDGQFGVVLNPLYPLAELVFGTTHFTLAELLNFHDDSPSQGIPMGQGILTITGYDQGVVNANGILVGTVHFTYQLTGAANNSAGAVTDSIPITLKDILGNSTLDFPKQLTIEIVDDSPQARPDTADVDEGGAAVSGNVVANDAIGADGAVAGGPVTGVAAGGTAAAGHVGSDVAGAYGTLVMGADGHYSYTLDPDDPSVQALAAGQTLTDVFTYEITDADGDVSSTTLTVTIHGVNDAPVNTLPAQYVATEDVPLTLDGLSISDVDAGDSVLTLTLQVDFGQLHGEAGAGVTISGDGTTTLVLQGTLADLQAWLAATPPTYVPVGDFHGDMPLSMVTRDDSGGVASDDILIHIQPVQDAFDDTAQTDEDHTLVIAPLANDTFSNPAAQITAIDGIAIAVGGGPVRVSKGEVTLNADGTLTYVPDADANGVAVFEYTVSSGGDVESANITVTIRAIDDAPVNTLPAGGYSAAEDSRLPLEGLSVADVDASGPITVTLHVEAGTLAALSGNGVTVSGSRTDTLVLTGSLDDINAFLAANAPLYLPVDDFNGSVLLTMTSDDGELSDVDTRTITIAPVADIADDTVSTDEDTPLTFNPLDNDSFSNADAAITAIDGQPISVGVPLTLAHGTVTLNDDGTLTFAPAANYNGPMDFEYTVTSGGTQETATIHLSVDAVNDVPVLGDPSVPGQGLDPATGTYSGTIDEDTAFTGRIGASDADGDALSYTETTAASHGTVSIAADGSYTYTPTADFNGADSFVVTVSDGHGGMVQATVKVGVNAVADVASDAVTTDEDTPVTFNVLANDSFENSGAVVTSITQPAAGGMVSFAADGTMTFTPAANFNGSTTFSYTVTSGGVTETATVTINVTAVNDVPVLNDPGTPGQT
uniref:tandem-95 repeat protein n=1 Tax=Pelomonas sp. KK5 TaxID=1855730 RepID=UPI00097BD263